MGSQELSSGRGTTPIVVHPDPRVALLQNRVASLELALLRVEEKAANALARLDVLENPTEPDTPTPATP